MLSVGNRATLLHVAVSATIKETHILSVNQSVSQILTVLVIWFVLIRNVSTLAKEFVEIEQHVQFPIISHFVLAIPVTQGMPLLHADE